MKKSSEFFESYLKERNGVAVLNVDKNSYYGRKALKIKEARAAEEKEELKEEISYLKNLLTMELHAMNDTLSFVVSEINKLKSDKENP